MAKIKEFEFKNVRSYGNQMTRIPFDMENGLVLILGENGHGKTSICEALEYGIYGKSSRVNSKNLPNWFNGNMFTNVTFETDDNRLVKLSRGLSPDYYKLVVGDNEESDSKNKNSNLSSKVAVDKYVENELIGIPFDVFSNNILLSVHDFKSFIKMKAADKRKIIDKIFDTDVFNQMLVPVKEELKEIKEKYSNLSLQYSAKEESYNALLARIEELKSKKDESSEKLLNSLTQRVDAIKAELTNLNERKTNLSNECMKRVSEHSASISDISSRKNNVISKYDESIKLIDSEYTSFVNSETETIASQKKTEIDAVISEMDSQIGDIAKPEVEIEKVKKLAEDKKAEQKSEYDNKVASLSDDLNSEIIKIKDETSKKLDESNRYYDGEINSIMSELSTVDDRITVVTENIGKLKTFIEDNNVKIRSIEERLELYRNNKCPMCGSDLEHEDFHIKNREALEKEYNDLSSIVTGLKSKLDEFNSENETLSSRKHTLESEINNLSSKKNNSITSINSDQDIRINSAKNSNAILLNEAGAAYNSILQKVDGILSEALSNASLRYNEKVSSIKLQYNNKISAIEESYKNKLDAIISEKSPEFESRKSVALNEKNANLSEIEKEENELNESYDDFNKNSTLSIESLTGRIEKMSGLYEKLSGELVALQSSNVESVLSELDSQATALYNEMSIMKTDIDSYKEKISVMDDVSFVIGDEGIKKVIMGRILPSFNEMIQKITQRFDFKYRFIFDDEFNCHMSFCGQPVPIATSRGEEKIMDIIVLLSTLKLILMKHKSVNILFLDEIFSNLDVNNIAKAVAILKDYAKEYNLNIFVMSHTTVPVELFDEIITVKNDGTFSHLEIEK